MGALICGGLVSWKVKPEGWRLRGDRGGVEGRSGRFNSTEDLLSLGL